MTVKHESKTGNDRRTYDLTSLLGKEPRHGALAGPTEPVEDAAPDRYRAMKEPGESDWSEIVD